MRHAVKSLNIFIFVIIKKHWSAKVIKILQTNVISVDKFVNELFVQRLFTP